MSGEEELYQARVFINGKVQGVFYRASLLMVAEENSISGWAKNLSDGSVEALLQGEKKAIETVIAWAKEGPPQAVVEKISVEWSIPRQIERGFRVAY